MLENISQTYVVLTNLFYAVIGVLLMGIADYLFFKMFDKITPFKTGEELDNGNVAVGIVVGCIILGINIGISIVIGMSLN